MASTCFGHLHAHHQEIRLRSTAYSCLSCCSCCDPGESGDKMCALCGECCLLCRQHSPHSAHILPPDSPASQQVHKLINSIWNKEQLPEEWKKSIIMLVYKKGDRSVVIKETYHFCQLRTKFYPTSCCRG